ncbi:MAG TPA: tRNA dihydrouridine(20/20a) synthase DusA [Candidatus Binatia bacterium]|nr:tRNA dihydrouridine(20/20a) synthase DusA [Candidatus Binatia bacterium]
MKEPDRRFSVAPLMDWTDRHCRAFHRALTRQALLYTEMITIDAVIHGDRERLLGFDAMEHPVALQLGGSDPAKIGEAARAGAAFGYDEINLNIGCPSDRVQAGRFGACLMREPELVAELWTAAQEAAPNIPVTIKSRIGVDEQEPRKALFALVTASARAGCRTFIVHARKAWLEGLSPKENREVPPLDYQLVRALKGERPDLEVILNGGLRDLDHALHEAEGLDGVMLGRGAYQTPATLLDVDARVFGAAPPSSSRIGAVEAHIPYMARKLEEGVPLHAMTRHMLGLFNAQPGGRAWRRILSERGVRAGAGLEVVRDALAEVARAPARAA